MWSGQAQGEMAAARAGAPIDGDGFAERIVAVGGSNLFADPPLEAALDAASGALEATTCDVPS